MILNGILTVDALYTGALFTYTYYGLIKTSYFDSLSSGGGDTIDALLFLSKLREEFSKLVLLFAFPSDEVRLFFNLFNFLFI